ncbi:O-antigen biosynthesis protein WlbA [Kribbella albertanoniae]|uniref:Gfo/Idh/MocA family oxidoreductase n=1 Tax=Kribbella albertanoniae TaxID=1266829 RepID=A0A4R4Q903_9ACTN|nr:Gfo/Idh/MocA family oxidoreductase [Kribbella albertanoniae]TDC31413.1 Gfo/Idh/MocA family oxidoreductase [Kribbella albertanoniae]
MTAENGLNSFHKRNEVRVGLVGAGSVAAVYLEAAAGLPGVAITAICDVRRDAAQALAGPLNASVYSDHRAMFAAGNLDAVIITSPHSLHIPMAEDAAAAGLHVLMEKPMATTVADCRKMIKVCADAGVRLAIGNLQRFVPAVRQASAILRSGELGRPLLITERRAVRYDPESRPAWFFDPELAGGGIMMNIGGHSIDKAQVLTGEQVVAVNARIWRRPGIAVETEASGVMELSGDIQLTFSITSTGLPPQDETEVVCEHGALRLSHTGGLWMFRDGKSVHLRDRTGHDEIVSAFRDQLVDFTGTEPPSVTGKYGLSVVAAVQAVYDSAADRSLQRTEY